MDKKLTFKITDENGKVIDCEEVYRIKSETNEKTYMVYTDHSLDKDGNLCTFAAIYNDDEKKLIPIENDEEWDFIENKIKELEGGDD